MTGSNNDWQEDYEYGFSRRDPNLDPAYDSLAQAKAMYFIQQW